MATWRQAVSGILIAELIAVAPVASRAQQPAAALQESPLGAGHAIREFSIPFAFARVKGRFTDWRGTILLDRSNLENSSLSMVIEAKSIDTGWPHRDEHLRTSDFFDVERFPRMLFKSDRVRR